MPSICLTLWCGCLVPRYRLSSLGIVYRPLVLPRPSPLPVVPLYRLWSSVVASSLVSASRPLVFPCPPLPFVPIAASDLVPSLVPRHFLVPATFSSPVAASRLLSLPLVPCRCLWSPAAPISPLRSWRAPRTAPLWGWRDAVRGSPNGSRCGRPSVSASVGRRLDDSAVG